MATDPGKPFWAKWGSRKPTSSNPLVGNYSVGDGWGESDVLATHNDDRASRVSGREPVKTAFHRGRLSEGESTGARLSISPSMKIPSNDAQSSLAGSTRVVKSKGRSGSFSAGQNVGY
jgi:hypothetical protein